MTRAEERLQQRATKAQAKIDAGVRDKQLIARKQRAIATVARDKRRLEIGTAAEDAGLFAYPTDVLRQAFVALARMSITDPQAVRELIGLDAILHGEAGRLVVTEEAGGALGGRLAATATMNNGTVGGEGSR